MGRAAAGGRADPRPELEHAVVAYALVRPGVSARETGRFLEEQVLPLYRRAGHRLRALLAEWLEGERPAQPQTIRSLEPGTRGVNRAGGF